MLLIIVWKLMIYQKGATWLIYGASIPVAFIVVGLIALIQYLIVLRPLASKGISIDGLMIATLGVDIILVGSLNILADYMQEWLKGTPLVTATRGGFLASYDPQVDGAYASSLMGPILLIVTTIVFYLFLTKTKFGTAMRAAIENPPLAETLGINVNLVYAVSWFIAGGLAGIAGIIMALTTKLHPAMGWTVIVSVFAGSIVGGLGSLFWGAIGGVLIGFLEQYGVYYTTKLLTIVTGGYVDLSKYRQIFSLGAIIVMLLIAPRGLASLNWRRITGRFRR